MIIGLTGYKGSGKTTVSQFLQDEFGFKPLNFKDGLIQEMKERLPDVLEMLRQHHGYPNLDYLFFHKPDIMRALMQNYGTEVRRGDNDLYWVEKWESVASTYPNRPIVTDDVRFLNEAEAVKKLGGIIIRVERDDITDGGDHQSETEQNQIKVDFVIRGRSGSHVEIFQQIRSIIDTIKHD